MPQIDRVLVLSTRHLPGGNAVSASEAACLVWEYGWLVWINDDSIEDEWYRTVRAYANSLGEDIDWVRFDCDVRPTPELPNYEW